MKHLIRPSDFADTRDCGKTVNFPDFGRWGRVNRLGNPKNYILIRKEVKRINNLASVYGYEHINYVEVETENTEFCDIDGVLFNADKTVLLFYPPAKPDKTYTVPDTVKVIAYAAFRTNKNLDTVILGKNVEDIDSNVFTSSFITSIVFNDKLQRIGEHAFTCTDLKNIVVPESVTTIENRAFTCRNLKDVSIKGKDVKLGDSIFYYCYKLENLEFCCDIKKEYKNLGIESPNIKSIKTPETEITFKKTASNNGELNITSLTHRGKQVDLPACDICPSSIWNIVLTLDTDSYSHRIKTSDNSINLKYTIAMIKLHDFDSDAAKSYIRGHADKIAAFYAENGDIDTVKEILSYATSAKLATLQTITRVKNLPLLADELKNYKIDTKSKTPDYTKRPAKYASTDHQPSTTWQTIMDGKSPDERKYVLIHKETNEINHNIYSVMPTSAIQYIEVEKGNESFVSVDGVLFSKDMTQLILYPAGKPNTEYRIPDGVKIISNFAFMKSKVEKIVMPDSVVDIRAGAFRLCRNLYSINLSKNLKHIGPLTFAECSSLRKLVIPQNVNEIEYDIIYKCDALESISIESTQAEISPRVIDNAKNLKSISFNCSIETMCKNPAKTMRNCGNLREFIVKNMKLTLEPTRLSYESKVKTISFRGQDVKFEKLYIRNELIPCLADMIESGRYGKYTLYGTGSHSMNPKYAVAIALYKTTGDKAANDYIHRGIRRICKSCIEAGDIAAIKDIIDQTNKQNIDDLIAYARECGQTEIQVMLEKHKNQNIGTKSLKL